MKTSYEIWVISDIYAPSDISTAHLLTKLVEELQLRGWHVRVLCATPEKEPSGKRFQGIVRVGLGREISTAKGRVFTAVTNALMLGAAAMKLDRTAVVLCLTNPPVLPLMIAEISQWRGFRYGLLVHDVYPDVLAAVGWLKRSSALYGILDPIFSYAVKQASQVIVLGRDMLRIIAGKRGGIGLAPRVIPNWADHDEIMPADRASNGLLRDLGLGSRFVVQYSGNLGRTHGVDDLLLAADGLRGTAEVRFLVIGAGARLRELETRVAKENLTNVVVRQRVPRAELPVSLNACDLAVIAFQPGMTGVSVPSRMYNIMAAGKPILAVADADSELAKVVQEEAIGWVVPPGYPEQMIAAINEACRLDAEALREMGKRARRAVEEKYTLTKAVDAYEEVLNQLACVEPVTVV